MLKLWLASFLLLLPVSCLGQTKTCTCTRNSPDQIYTGGDSEPLTWYSLERLERPGTAQVDPVYCYERSVHNHSARDVTDVDWEIAFYYRKVVPKQREICDPVTILGELQRPSLKGLLNYGVGTGSYPTTAYTPSKGWTTANIRPLPGGPPGIELSSAIEVASTAYPSPVTLRFYSDVGRHGDGIDYKIQIESTSKGPLRVLWSIPMTKEFRSFEISAETPPVVSSSRTFSRSAFSADPLGWTTAEVSIYDSSGTRVARGIASTFCSLDARPPSPTPDRLSKF